jgi:regulator of cell morphogenesis and NO signaling
MNRIQSKSDEKLEISNRQNPETLGTREQIRSTLDFEGWELDDLVDYILNTHHYFAWVNLPVLKEYALKTARNQGANCPQAIEVNRQFKELASSIEDHLQTQEHKTFPAIKQLVFASRDGYQIRTDSIESLVLNMEA